MADSFEAYSRQLTLCMMTYQFIEFGLRFSLHRCHAVTKFRLEGYLPYSYRFEAIEEAALGRLVEWFKAYTTNTSLIEDLRKIKKKRDEVAHQGYVFTIEEQRDDALLKAKTEELVGAHAQAKECYERLQEEMHRVDEVVNRAYADLKKARSAGEGVAP